jgi:hypothetical protein
MRGVVTIGSWRAQPFGFEPSVHRHEVFIALPTQHAAPSLGLPTPMRIGRTVVVEQEPTATDWPL